jgi:hypothetical protein
MDMPIETQEQLVEEDIVTDTRADTFLISLLAKRKEAIDGRAGSGIEQDWAEDEEHYQGIDDANRAYATTSNVIQAKNWAERYSRENPPGTRSVIFLNITRPYVDAGSARVADMLLPTDDRSWALKPTPIPRLSPAQMMQMGGPENAQLAIEQSIEIAKEASKAMQDEIDDCVNEANWHGEIRQVIEDSARIGTGCVKGPYPVKRSARMYQKTDGVSVMTQIDEIKPGSKRIACENLYPDPACGESIHNGSYIWEREDISGKQLLDLVKLPGYDKMSIMQALKEGPKTAVVGASTRPVAKSEEQFELWIFYGNCDADDLGAVGVEMDDETPKASAMAVLVNDRMIKCTLNALDTGEFPYDVLAWQRRPGMPWGSGVGRHIRTVQRMLNGAARAMMDNAGLTASPQIIIGNGVSPADGKTAITGGKLWRADTDTLDVRGAFHAFVPPSIQVEMMNIINFALKLAEDTTGMPAMLQGIRGDAPETLGGMQLQDTRASGVLRRLAKRFDDYLTEPHIRRYYDWMMQHSDREDIKGDFQIDVRASSALVERDAQQQFLLTLLTAAANPIYELDPAKLAAELLKGQRYDPKRIQYSPEKLAQLQDTSNPVEAAKADLIAAQTLKTKAETTTKNVEGMFSATSAANQIAMVPSIAPLADAMLLSAGFVDANAAPSIPEVPAGVQGVPMQENTSPNFPPQPGTPPNPDVGMDAGIETGAQIDGDEDRD